MQLFLKNNLPNILTLLNVACGFAALISLVDERYVAAILWMFIATVFDGIDGKIAALLNSKSEIGKTLDSLSDVISFALLPGVAVYFLYARLPDPSWLTLAIAWVVGIGYTCAGILREIRFLSGQSQRTRREGFIGLPIAPPAGFNVTIVSLVYLLPDVFMTPLVLVLVLGQIVLDAYLMTISNINYLRWGGKLIAVQAFTALFFGILGYLLLGTLSTALALFFMAFCLVYIWSHVIRAGVLRLLSRQKTAPA